METHIEIWKAKKNIKMLEDCRGIGTNLISLIIPPGEQIAKINKLLEEECGTTANIKSKTTKNLVKSAIVSIQAKLKLYNKIPENGLVFYCGTIVQKGKERKILFEIEPFKQINTSLYICDNKFHLEPLKAILDDGEKYGFIIVDGSGALFGSLQGNTRIKLLEVKVDLPKKHGRGGQSALRFARLREEKRHNFIRKIAETATTLFITENTPNISGLFLAGSADLKTILGQSNLFDSRLQAKILRTVDVAYGGENGFNQAIELVTDVLENVKFIQEKKILNQYFNEISNDTERFCFGIADTMLALKMGAAEIVICWERFQEKLPKTIKSEEYGISSSEEKTSSQMLKNRTNIMLASTNPNEEPLFVDWISENASLFGTKLEFVTENSKEGNQFVKGFGGIGCILRYPVNFSDIQQYENEKNDT